MKNKTGALIVCIFSVIAFLVVLFAFIYVEVYGQKGCGEWVKADEYPRGNFNLGSVFIVWIDGHHEYFDSVWVPKPCPEKQDSCGEWKYRWVKQECMRSLDLSGIQNAVWQAPDTCWQQERYRISKPCPDDGNDNYLRRNTAYPYAVDPPQQPCIRDTIKYRSNQMTVEEKVDMLFDMVLSLRAEIDYLKRKVEKGQ